MAKTEAVSPREVRELLDELETGIERLRVAYDKYFAGVDRIAPVQLSEKVHRLLHECEAARPRQTAQRFRLNGLRARLVTYRYYWTRVLAQIENGTYRRHLLRAERRQRDAEPDGPSADAVADSAPEAGREIPGGPPVRKGPPPPPPTVPGMDPRKVRALFDELVKAKSDAGEDTSGLTFRGLCKQLARDAPRLRKQHGDITFVVARDGGRVRLKAKVGGSG